jgi:hypothetical protein
MAVEQFHAVVTGLACRDVFVAAHPGHEVAGRRAALGLIAEGDDEPAVGGEDAHVPVARQAPRGVDGLRPGRSLVAAEHHEAPAGVGVLPQQAAQFLAIG